MNIPGITRALELDDADWDLAVKLRGLTEHQREQFSAALGPVRTEKKLRPQSEKCGVCNMTRKTPVHSDKRYTDYHEFEKKSNKKSAGGGRGSSKSARASGIAKALNDNLSQRRQEALEDITGESREPCATCSLRADANVHHLQTQDDYHEFVPPAQQAAATGGD